MWAAAATSIDAYRDRYGITGPDCLGERPDQATDLEQARAYEHAETLAHQIERHLELTLEADLGMSR